MSRRATPESFWARINILGSDDCWGWQSAQNNLGYGTLRYQGQYVVAHRVAYYLTYGGITLQAPKDRTQSGFLLHACDNPPCCNPKHTRVGTYTENQKDAYLRNRRTQPKGFAHANAKLTWEEAAEIRAKYSSGVVQIILEKEYKVSQRVISLIVRGETYQ